MVNDTIEISAHIYDFKLDSATTTARVAAEQQQQHQQAAHLKDEQKHDRPASHQRLSACPILSAAASPRQSGSAEKLSWTFFEQVSSVDQQLRRDDEPSATASNGCFIPLQKVPPLTATAAASGVEEIADGAPQRRDRHETISCKQNGFIATNNNNNNIAITTTTTDKRHEANSIDCILSQQQLTDSVRVQQHLQLPQPQHQPLSAAEAASAAFQFTSPTATFKRRKAQQEQRTVGRGSVSAAATPASKPAEPTTTTPLGGALRHKTPQQITNSPTTQRGNEATTNGGATSSSHSSATTAATHPGGPQEQRPLHSDTGDRERSYDSAGRGATAAATAHSARTTAAPATGIAVRTRTLPAITKGGGGGDGVLTFNAAAGGGRWPSQVVPTTTASNETKGRVNGQQRQRKMGATHTNNSGGSRASSNGSKSGGAAMGSHSFVDGIEMHLGLIGWRKKCLYTLLVLLMLLIITNLVLTLWILKVMEFTTDGMGQLKIIPGGIQLTGQAIIMDMLRASTIRSRHGQPIAIESSRNFSINTRDTNGMLENHLFLGHDKLECLASGGFRINDTTGRNLFSVNRNEVTIGAHALRIDGEGGAIFRESIQTPHVRAEPGRELRLESPTRELEMTAAKDINLQSRAGGIELLALEDVKLTALDGSLRLESSKILMPNLRTAQPPIPGTAQSRDHLHRVFQLCACSNGKLFLAASHSICAGDDSTVCR